MHLRISQAEQKKANARIGSTPNVALEWGTFHRRTLQFALLAICIADYTAWKWWSIRIQKHKS